MLSRRGFLGVAAAVVSATAATGLLMRMRQGKEMITVYTFGDSILDCGRYNSYGINPGQLLVANDDRLFSEFKGQDLRSRGPARLEHRAQDGATVRSLPGQSRGIHPRDVPWPCLRSAAMICSWG